MAKGRARSGDPVVDELEQIKRLMMLQMMIAGVKANQIAKALGVQKSVISGIIPIRSIKTKD